MTMLSTTDLALPAWQVAVLLVAVPVTYQVASVLTPWALGLWRDEDRTHFVPFWGSMAVLHWLSVSVATYFLWSEGYALADVGLSLPSQWWVTGATAVVGLAGLATYYDGVLDREPLAADAFTEKQTIGLVPATNRERGFMLLVGGVTAGFCEELVYRGVGLTALVGLGASLPVAVVATSVAFAAAFVLTGSLVPGMVLHGATNLVVFRDMTERHLA